MKIAIHLFQMVLPWCVLPDWHPGEEVEQDSGARVERNFPETVALREGVPFHPFPKYSQ